MALRNIVIKGDDILRKRAKEVIEINDRIHIILDDMQETMRVNNGVGLAAPQVGILKRMFIVNIEDQLIELINPEIVETEGIQNGEEGCLSIPGFCGIVERPARIKIKGLNRDGQAVTYEGTDMLAVALSHEYDHLEGVLYTDKAVNIRDINNDNR